MTTRYTVDPAEVVHETLDGETVLIHLRSGVYFSLTGSGPALWDLLVAGHTVAEIAGAVGEGAAEISALADQLVAEELLQPGDLVVGEATFVGPYISPVFARYDDMQYLLLIDPIHEASDNGWPSRAETVPAP